MATTTPNFGFDIPQSTDLVKDGATAIAALGTDIDTAFVDLKGGTTGQVLSKASGTDLDFTWVTDAAGDITGVTAGTGISGGGTSGTVTVTNSMATAIDAKGDLIGGTGADAFARLAIGTNGQVLTADSAETTGMKWATTASGGGMTSIASGTLSGATVSLTSISGSYKNLQLVIRDFYPSTNQALRLKFNSTNVATDYLSMISASTNGGTGTFSTNWASTSTPLSYNTDNNASSGAAAIINIFDYANTSAQKQWTSQYSYKRYDNGNREIDLIYGVVNTTSAISQLDIAVSSGTMNGTYILYGVN